MSTNALLLALACAPHPGADEAQRWSLRLTPYLWAPSVSGTLRIEGVGGGGEDEGGSVLDDLAGAGMVALEARRGDWSLLGDLVVTHFRFEGTTDGPLAFAYESSHDEVVAGLGVARTVARASDLELQAFLGVRYLHVDVGLEPQAGGPLRLDARADLFDPIVGVRGRWGGEQGWFGVAHADVGGFGVSSDLTWQLFGGAGWAWSWGDVRAGWRALAYDFDSSGLLYDLTGSGPFLGLSFRL